VTSLKLYAPDGSTKTVKVETNHLSSNPEISYVYFIGIEGSNLVKIGYTSNSPQKRLSNLQVGSPHKLYLIRHLSVLDPVEAERVIHKDLQQYRKQGEWFDLPDGYLTEYIDLFLECRLNDYI
jgi:hypothetical protein